MLSVRAAAAQVIAQILTSKGSLSSLLPAVSAKIADNDRALLQELCFGTCRYYPQLQAYTECLLNKPLRAKDGDVQALLLLVNQLHPLPKLRKQLKFQQLVPSLEFPTIVEFVSHGHQTMAWAKI